MKSLSFCNTPSAAKAPICRRRGGLVLAQSDDEAVNEGKFLRTLTKVAKLHWVATGIASLVATDQFYSAMGGYKPTGTAETNFAKAVGGAYLTAALALRDRTEGDDARAGFATVAPFLISGLVAQRNVFTKGDYELEPLGMAHAALRTLEAGVGAVELVKIVRDKCDSE